MQEAARLLGVEYEAFKLWAFERVKPSYEEWSRWNNETDIDNSNKSRPLPEAIIRLYLTWLRQLEAAPTQAELTAGADRAVSESAQP